MMFELSLFFSISAVRLIKKFSDYLNTAKALTLRLQTYFDAEMVCFMFVLYELSG